MTPSGFVADLASESPERGGDARAAPVVRSKGHKKRPDGQERQDPGEHPFAFNPTGGRKNQCGLEGPLWRFCEVESPRIQGRNLDTA